MNTLLKADFCICLKFYHIFAFFTIYFRQYFPLLALWYSVPLFNILHSGYNQLVGIFIDCSCSFIHHTNSNNSSTFPSSILIVTFCLLKCTPPYTDGASSIEKLHLNQDFWFDVFLSQMSTFSLWDDQKADSGHDIRKK